jgi:uncharacterized protein (TIGR02246 family)
MKPIVLRMALALSLVIPAHVGAQSAPPPQSQGSPSQEIDADVWTVVSTTVAAGDAAGMGRTYHPDAVLVNETRTATIADTMVRWTEGMAKAKREGGRSTVVFRFARRQDNPKTAFESGIFKLTDHDRAGVATVVFIPFEMLLVKKDGAWRILMERQLARVDEAAWNKLTP